MKKRILAVDDDPAALGALRQMLTQKGYEVVTAADGEAGLEAVRAGCDLVILDVAMPGITGHEVCRRIREDPATREIPVIFLTARGQLVDIAEGHDAGSDLYLVKPVLATKLLGMVEMFLSEDAPLSKRRRPDTAR